MSESSNHQAPASACGYGAASRTCARVEAKRSRANLKEFSIPKLQTLASAADSMFGIWGLGFIWSLELGIWSFA